MIMLCRWIKQQPKYKLIGYDFDGESVHEHFAKIYDCEYDEAKQKTFQILYGGIREEH